jgi:TolA-binding protein
VPLPPRPDDARPSGAPANPDDDIHHVRPIAFVWAALAVAASIGGAVFVTRWTPMTRTRSTTVVAPPSSRPAAPDHFVLAFEKPEAGLPPPDEHAGTSAGGGQHEYVESLDRALAPYRRGDAGAAVVAFEDLGRRFPARPEAAFYLGIARLMKGDATSAIEPLTAARRLSTGNAEADASWYLAVALERSDRPRDAAAVIAQLCERDSPRKAASCSAAAHLGLR